jgi:exodeoxyribonuclease V gamma subunit
MAGFKIHYSNRTEILFERLADAVSNPPPRPLEPEIIVVQSKGMERWLRQQLATRLGIWANAWFPFPNLILQEFFQVILSDIVPDERFSPELLTWRIQLLLRECLSLSGFEQLKNYLSGEKRGLRQIQLCQRIADTFDQYTLYRPEMVLRWERGEESHWQAQLWRKLVAGETGSHRAALRQRFLAKLRKLIPETARLPRRVSVFGIPALPRYHVEVLAAVGRVIDVQLFLLSPSREFWAEILSEREQSRRHRRERKQMQLAFPANPYFETGHPLLASLGKLGRDFSAFLLDLDEVQDESHYEEPGDDTLLACLQSDILNLRHRGRDGQRKAIPPSDNSLQIHSCHSPMREIEVLHDSLLAFLDEDSALQPNEILVMTPDIELYAPYISAVFGGIQDDGRRIPFSIADRAPNAESVVVQAFLKILALAGSRLAAPAILDLLDAVVVRQRFGIRSEDREVILEWVRQTRICWGIDANDREQLGLPAFDENSWRPGLDRLLLGYALPETEMFAGILPAQAIEGDNSRVLGRFVEFLAQLFTTVRDLDQPRSLAEWSRTLLALLSQLLSEDENRVAEFQLLRGQIRRLAELQTGSSFADPVELDVIRYWLEGRLRNLDVNQAFPSGGVTFCAMLPMRSVPFRVIALVGMDYRTFPRSNQALAFDLIAAEPKPGDRFLKEEDRYLFLEALLSARKKLYISYVGQSIRDNSEIPPSVVVSELIEAIEQGFTTAAERKAICQHVCFRHHLQAFHPSYFSSGSRLFSYSQENFEALQARQKQRESSLHSAPFVVASIGEIPEELRRLDIVQLKRFYKNPTRYFFQHRLGLRLEDDAILLDGREPFSLEALDRYALEQSLVIKALAGEDIHAAYAWARCQGILPAGSAGEAIFRSRVSEVAAFVARLRPLLEGDPLPVLDFELNIAEFHVTGRIDRVWPRHLLRYRCAAVTPKDRLDSWIDHLALRCCDKAKYPRRTVVATADRMWNYREVDNAPEILGRLLVCYAEGLREPLRFFPKSAYQYARSVARGQGESSALRAAEKVWVADSFRQDNQRPAESEDVYHQLAFGNVNPLDSRFKHLAIEVFGPPLEHEEDRQ